MHAARTITVTGQSLHVVIRQLCIWWEKTSRLRLKLVQYLSQTCSQPDHFSTACSYHCLNYVAGL